MSRKSDPKTDDRRLPSSPYGPHPRGTDEAAGGADSSPYEAEASGERMEKAEEDQRLGRVTNTGENRNRTS